MSSQTSKKTNRAGSHPRQGIACVQVQYCAILPMAPVTRDQQHDADATPNVPTIFTYIGPPFLTRQSCMCQSLGWIGTCLCASDTSAVNEKLRRFSCDFYRINRLISEATGERSWSRMLVRQLTYDIYPIRAVEQDSGCNHIPWFLLSLRSQGCNH